MKISSALINLVLAASVVDGAPHKLQTRSPGGEVVVYWGQNAAAASENNDLSTYCTADSGINIVVLAFLYEYGNNIVIPSGVIGKDCSISTSGEGINCDALASQIATCQSNNVKVILSLGGAVGAYSLTSQSEAEKIGQNLWDAYGKSAGGSIPRPFGSISVDGWDFDLESNSGNQYYQYMISKLRSNFKSDSGNTYYITGAPQCPIPEPNMGEIIQAAQFDYLWVQFYNNEYCSYPNTLNYAEWVSYISRTPSNNAKIFIGVPASELGSTGTESGATYYQSPSILANTVASFDTSSNWGGIMMWDAAFSNANVVDGCNYAQQAQSILKTGSPCGGNDNNSPMFLASTVTSTTTTATPSTSSTTATTASVLVAQWGQCGGDGYTGSTVCASPYRCIRESKYWSSCQ
ncbi:chitinase 3 precursor, putative [Talaromyces stipitatus ATCC 10500]|uniref:Chitinase 3, putative n=1 Tax=Talaromyces stipitatus (strain ATCC 10500 / CBS 375.48 / QM 6759 / NRRL 1006) TaxID=441959 RepID=B8LXT3_TALSN|nr:chitinase 3 precursor, putative [Talaromyces stipitatus ATCC 10500]EED22748.1 chitinase 3 precursor, putative [Talaromyces stipitatus ATCC 10500]